MYFQETIGLASSTQAGKLSSAQYSALVNLLAASSVSHKWIASIGADGTIHLSQPATSDLADAGQPYGAATLNSGGQLNSAQIPTALVGSVVYVSGWNAATNSPSLASGVGTKGNYYVVTTAGTTSLDGNATWGVGDVLLFNGTAWEQLKSPANQVVSFNGRTGAVSPQSSDYSADFAPLAGGTSIVTVGTVASGTWQGTAIAPTYGGTGANNGSSTLILGGSVTFSGAHTCTITLSGATAITLPTSGTLETTAGVTSALATALPSATTSQLYGGTGAAGAAQAITLGSGLSLSGTTLSASGGGGGGSSAGSAGEVQYSDGSGGFLADTSTLDGSGNWSGSSINVLPTSGNAWSSPNATIDYQGNVNFDATQITSLVMTTPWSTSGGLLCRNSSTSEVGWDSVATVDGAGNLSVASLQNATVSFTVDTAGNVACSSLKISGTPLQNIATAGIPGATGSLPYCDGLGGASGASNTSLNAYGALQVASIEVPGALADGTYSIAGGAGSITITNGMISAVS